MFYVFNLLPEEEEKQNVWNNKMQELLRNYKI